MTKCEQTPLEGLWAAKRSKNQGPAKGKEGWCIVGKLLSAMSAVAAVVMVGTSQAALVDRGGGMIYDTTLNITWLADANYSKTSGYDPDGRMAWAAALVWADQLTYGGFEDWRLPTTVQPDTTCSIELDGVWYGYGCIGGEMGHLFYLGLSGTAQTSILNSADVDLGLFKNIQADDYWTSVGFIPPPNSSVWTSLSSVWTFDMSGGNPHTIQRDSNYYAWAVRDGDVADIPEPATLALVGLALAGLGLSRRRQ